MPMTLKKKGKKAQNFRSQKGILKPAIGGARAANGTHLRSAAWRRWRASSQFFEQHLRD
jgi:hypothetical protein